MEDYSMLLNKHLAFFRQGKTKDVAFRLEALEKLGNAIRKHEASIVSALQADLNKSEFESYSTEIGIILEEIRFTMRHLQTWVKPQKVKTPKTHIGSRSFIYSEPYGAALIIAPWNYPFQLAVAPLIGAISSGNCAVVKPSELTPKTSQILWNLIREIFPEDYISVIQGGAETTQALLHEPFDYLFFTGSVPIGKLVMEAASKNLTPVTLELGGKSPCIVHKDANCKLAAKRVAWGKFMNAGQTCVAPDYLYVHRDVKDAFLKEFEKSTKELYGNSPLESPDFTRIVNDSHFQRLCSFLDNGEVFFGGGVHPERLVIEPTVLTRVTWSDPVMQNEIFGPILPVLEYDRLSQVMEEIERRPKPLALYLFTKSNEVQQSVLNRISFGGGCINDTVYHFVSPYLPFGGVGDSGMGAYHGKGSFDVFSHKKSILNQTTLFDIPFRYPNTKNGLKRIKKFFK